MSGNEFVYVYIPLIIAFLSLYLRVVELIYDFDWLNIGRVFARFVYVCFYWYTLKVFLLQFKDLWFLFLVGLSSGVLFVDEIIYLLFKDKIRNKVIKMLVIEINKTLEADASNYG